MTRLPRRCLDCDTLTSGNPRCATCSRRRDANYGEPHRRARADLLVQLRATEGLRHAIACGLCHQPLTAADNVHADHIIPLAGGGTHGGWQLTHATCNLKAGDKKGMTR